jgi:hypothetical protein
MITVDHRELLSDCMETGLVLPLHKALLGMDYYVSRPGSMERSAYYHRRTIGSALWLMLQGQSKLVNIAKFSTSSSSTYPRFLPLVLLSFLLQTVTSCSHKKDWKHVHVQNT